jgi:hypothetical protein
VLCGRATFHLVACVGVKVASLKETLSASAYGYQQGWLALIPDPSPALREKGV